MNYILFDTEQTWENLLPLTWTRPVSELRTGILTIREKWEKQLGTKLSWLTKDFLQELYPPRVEDDNILINGSVLPDRGLISALGQLEMNDVITAGEIIVAARIGKADVEGFMEDSQKFEFNPEPVPGPLSIAYPWDIFLKNGEAMEADFELLTSGRKSQPLSSTNRCLGTENIFIEEGARVECAILNAEAGPIYIGRDAEVMEGSIVRGPFALCEGSQLKLGAKIYGPTTIGPSCKVGGEVNNSVVMGYSNKSHDGFLGNSVLGQWCNIGADSNNSNLKNNYASVKLWSYGKEKFVDSGLQFLGLIMGDHSKCGINTMFNTGTVVGVSANIYGDGFPRNFIPSFSWGGPQGFTTFRIDKAFEVAERVMERRDIPLTDADRKLLTTIFDLTEKYRS